MVKKIKIEPTYRRGNGVFVINLDEVDLPFKVKEKSVVYIPPKKLGGNHKHPRTEAFIIFGKGIELIWVDKNGSKHIEKASKELYLFVVSPFTPHVVVNKSETEFGILVEYASEVQRDVERIGIVKE